MDTRSPIAFSVSKAIRLEKWMEMEYLNTAKEKTRFLAAVEDIDFARRLLICSVFNPWLIPDSSAPSDPTEPFPPGDPPPFPLKGDYRLYFDRILRADLVPNLTYRPPPALLDKCSACPIADDFLHFNETRHTVFNVLSFLDDCLHFDTDPTVEPFPMLPGIDADSFARSKTLILPEAAVTRLVGEWCRRTKNKAASGLLRLAFNRLSLKIHDRNLPILYQNISLSVKERTLTLGKELLVSKSLFFAGKHPSDAKKPHSPLPAGCRGTSPAGRMDPRKFCRNLPKRPRRVHFNPFGIPSVLPKNQHPPGIHAA